MHRHKAPKILWNKEDIKSEKASNTSTHIVDIWSIAAIGMCAIMA